MPVGDAGSASEIALLKPYRLSARDGSVFVSYTTTTVAPAVASVHLAVGAMPFTSNQPSKEGQLLARLYESSG